MARETITAKNSALENNTAAHPQNKLFDLLAVFFISFHLVFLLLNWNHYPTELDTSYHLLMGKMFAQEEKIALWDSYEFAPVGRPHLYPPLEHIIIWFVRFLTQVSYMDIGRILVILQTILALFFIWSISRKFFNPAIALFSLIFFCANTDLWWWQTSVGPVALAVVLFLPFLYLYYKKKTIPAILVLTTCLYLHYWLSLILILSIFLATVSFVQYRKAYLKKFFLILSISLLLFSPWLSHIYHFRYYLFNHVKNLPTQPLLSLKIAYKDILSNLNIVFLVFLIAGIVYAYKRVKDDFKYCLFLAGFLVSFLNLFLFSGFRFNAFLALAGSTIAALGVYAILRRTDNVGNRIAASSIKIFLSILLFSAVFIEFHYAPPYFFKAKAAPISNEIRSIAYQVPLQGKNRIGVKDYFSLPETQQLLDYIKENIDKNAVIHINIGDLADYITLETGIKTDTGMFWEIVTPEMIERIDELRRSGFYISTISNFDNLLPPDYVRDKKFPKILKKIGTRYIGYL